MPKVIISNKEYQDGLEYICPCFNPYCYPREYAPCKGRNISPALHKKMLEENWLEELGFPVSENLEEAIVVE